MAMFQDLLGCLLKQTICGMIETLLRHSSSVFTTALDSWLNKRPSKTTAKCLSSTVIRVQKSLVVIHRFYFTCCKLTKEQRKKLLTFFFFFKEYVQFIYEVWLITITYTASWGLIYQVVHFCFSIWVCSFFFSSGSVKVWLDRLQFLNILCYFVDVVYCTLDAECVIHSWKLCHYR